MRINKILFLPLIFLLVVSYQAQDKSRTAEFKRDEIIEVGYVDSFEKLPKLKFEKISEAEFSTYKSENFIVVPKIKQNRKTFYIQTDKNRYEFKKFPADEKVSAEKNGFKFAGYYPNLKLFAINDASVSEGIKFGNLVLIDKETDHKYKIVSIGDGAVETPIPSKNNQYLVYFHNYDYQHKNSFIAVLKVGEKSEPKKFLQEYASFQSDYFAVEKIIWLNDDSFIVKGFEEVFENDKWVKKYSFYKTSFK